MKVREELKDKKLIILKVQSCTLNKKKYTIASTQI